MELCYQIRLVHFLGDKCVVNKRSREKPGECQVLGVSKAADKYTVATWLRTWYEFHAKLNICTATANRYKLTIAIARIGDVKLKKLTTRHHLQKLYKELLEGGKIHIGIDFIYWFFQMELRGRMALSVDTGKETSNNFVDGCPVFHKTANNDNRQFYMARKKLILCLENVHAKHHLFPAS